MKKLDELRWYTVGKLNRYPHIFGYDAKLLDLFIETFFNKLIKITYDVPVGEGITSIFPELETLSNNWRYSSSHKIDVLAETNDEFWLIEIKANGIISAIGQLISYKCLLKETYFITKPIKLILLCSYTHPDLKTVAKQNGIEIIQFSPKLV